MVEICNQIERSRIKKIYSLKNWVVSIKLLKRRDCMQEQKIDKALLNLDEFCSYLGIGKTKARELLHDPRSKFTVRLGNRLFAHKKKLDEWLEIQVDLR